MRILSRFLILLLFTIIIGCLLHFYVYTSVSHLDDASFWNPLLEKDNLDLLSQSAVASSNNKQQEQQEKEEGEEEEEKEKVIPSTENITKPFHHFFIHIPKAGGRAFQSGMKKIAREQLKKNQPILTNSTPFQKWIICDYGVTQIQSIQKIDFWKDLMCLGHMSETHYNGSAFDHAYTIVRSPQEHVISQYFHCKEATVRSIQIRSKMPSLDTWLDDWNSTMVQYSNASLVQQKKILEDMNKRYRCYVPIDLQSTFLNFNRGLSSSSSREESKIDLQSRFDVIGLLDQFEKSLCLIAISMTNGFIPEQCNCTGKQQEKQQVEQVNINGHISHGVTHHGSTFNSTEQQKKLIHELTKSDQLLYEYSKEIFEAKVKEMEEKYLFHMC